VQRAGAEVVIASSDSGGPIEWAFAAPVQNDSRGDGALAFDPKVGDWVSRFFERGE